ncbi:MAG: FtsH protease activity modulator HflK [Rhodospirillaceae bacterium]|nr:FtsH protease activity modulator HflK [Rhodospirillaceae bacterium]MBT6912406.1 FtsH protease activity modulator HflK [Rhodospirillaceae bacterium]MBT7284115.1 FtsH protease activity modulator HflK [Rhodospirillaceae bacterium]MBT7666583.1 FtsH protease activity modulator HflK [Rhodospirillaceae bacterium]MBT7978601.1 FtsH protease activity modulator HflK [Rhodospirillaceae bacterium]
MPWSNQGGGGSGGSGGGGGGGWQGGGRGPWGQGGGGGGGQPPNLEELLRKGQDRFKGVLPGGNWGGRGIFLILLVLVAAWAFTGFYRVGPDEQGVVLRFGKFTESTAPGLHYHLPAPIESALTPKVTRVNRVEVGFQSSGDFGRSSALRNLPEESLMLTGDENIVDINFTVLWQISNAGHFLFNIQRPENTVKAVAESVMREVVGRSQINAVLSEGRNEVELQTLELMQKTLDEYKAGIVVTQVKLAKADPPAAVIDAFRDVQAARADEERLVNEAKAYSNDILPRARGEAERIRQEAEGYQKQTVAQAEGEVSRYLAIQKEYQLAPDVTRKRLYLETMEEVLQGTTKIVIDNEGGSQGVLPYLPLPELQRGKSNTGAK